MRLRKYLVRLLAVLMITGTMGMNAYAAEAADTAVTTDVETQSGQTTTEAAGTTDEAEDKNTSQIPAESTTEEEKKADSEKKEEETSDKDKKKKKKSSIAKKTSAKKKQTAKKTSVEKKKAVKYSSQELRLLSSLIYCEAGNEPYAGKVAVGIVVMNRKASGKFPGSVKSVIYQKYQFGPVRNGSLNRALSRYDSKKFTTSREKDSLRAAKEALSGTKKVTYKGKTINMASYLYFSGRVSKPKVTIGNHQFR